MPWTDRPPRLSCQSTAWAAMILVVLGVIWFILVVVR
jgi:hypothetical protein